jgi:carbon starvation protein CstA
MYTFLSCVALLIIGYLTYGKFIEKIFGVKKGRPTPAFTHADGVDYLPMGTSKNSLIQLLNIAGTGLFLVQLWEHFTDQLLLSGLLSAVFSWELSTFI